MCKYIWPKDRIKYHFRTCSCEVRRIGTRLGFSVGAHHVHVRDPQTGATESGTRASSLARAQTPSPQQYGAAFFPSLQHVAAKDQTRQSGTPSLCVAAYSTNISSFSIGELESLTHAAQNISLQQHQCMCLAAGNSEGPNSIPRLRGRQPSRREARRLVRPCRPSISPGFATPICPHSG